MNLTIGCKIEQQYYLMNGEPIDKQEWTSLVRQHIKQNGNEKAFEKEKATVTLWSKHDTLEEIALQVYASKYCTNLQVEKRERAVKPIKAEKEIGYKQLTIC
jgi:hypothetical protein